MQGQAAQQLVIEVGQVIEAQQVVVVVDAIFPDRAIETFAVGVHPGGLRVGLPMDEKALGERRGEVPLEIRGRCR